jgi:signal transduction histidine kinase
MMVTLERSERENRVLVLAPTTRDAEITARILSEAGVRCHICRTMEEVCTEYQGGAGAALLTQEAILSDRSGSLAALLSQQPPWSDFPLVVLTAPGSDKRRAHPALEAVGHMTLLPRPVQMASLVSTVRAALRDRDRQYALRRHLAEQEQREATLREADRKKDEFLATLAHELRNPLAPIRNAVQLIELKRPTDAELRWACDVAVRQVAHLTRLIDDLLDISRITTNKLELRRDRVELADVVRQALEASRPVIDQFAHELSVTLPGRPVYLNGDLVRLAQIVLNLLNNAAKYTPRGGRIELVAGAEGGEVRIAIKDNGIGIEPHHLSQIFEMFSQVAPALDRSQGGLGIGLALVKGLVKMHGGSISADSDGPGRGSEFTVRLPTIEEDSERIGHSQSQPVLASSVRRRILVVDDNRDAADSLAATLRLIGHELHTAYDGLEALRRSLEFRPEVILLDIGMPKLNGYETAARIREQLAVGRPMLIAITGWGQEEDRDRARRAGFDGHLVKPVNFAHLREMIERQSD